MKKMLFVLTAALFAAAFAQEKTAAEGKAAPALNWDAAPADIVLQAYAEQVNRTMLADPSLPKATITLKSREGQKLTVEEYLEAIEVVLEMNGIHLEPYGEKFIRAVPRAKVRKEGIPLFMDVSEVPDSADGGRVVSVRFVFKNIGVDEAQKALEGFKSDTGLLQVFERNNTILITDTLINIQRMAEIARSLDVATPVTENVFVRQIAHASANDIKTALEAIVQESQKEQEKNGKAAQNANNNQPQTPSQRLLASRNAQQQQQQQQQQSNASLVMSVSDADRGMIRGKVLILSDERSNKLIIVTQKANMDFFDKVIEQLDVPTTPDVQVKVYRLKYAEAEEVSDMINDLIGNSSSSKNNQQNQNANARAGGAANLTRGGQNNVQARRTANTANQRSGESKAGELSKDNVTVLADKRINGLVVMARTEDIPTIEQIIESMDVKLSQVLIETVIIEVTLGDDLKTGIDWVQNGRMNTTSSSQVKNSLGQNMYYLQRSSDSGVSVLSSAVPEGYSRTWTSSDGTQYTDSASSVGVFETVSGIVKDGFWTGSSGFAQMLGGGSSGGSAAADIVTGVATNVFGSAFNYIFKSDKLNLSAVIQATKNDSRTKYLASPVVMTVDNKEATIDATESRKFFSGYETSSSYSSYMRTPKYDSKDIGIKIKVTPKINPNGTVMLNVEEEYSQVVEGGQSILVGEGSTSALIDTALQRKMSADVLLENMQTVILCGLTETYTAESESGIPFLKDIPFIGKWLFGSVSQKETRKELLIFMTPYVLNDGDAAQAEALRRKNTLSDSSPWDDHGWSLSELADPVSKKEQLRRLKEAWKKQDEERKTKLAIESEKIKRAKALQEMSKEERDFWIELHKEELDEEAQEALEEKQEDDRYQGELRKLATEIRARKLAESKKALTEADEASRRENERGRLEAEKSGEDAKDVETFTEREAVAPAAEPAAPAAELSAEGAQE